MSATLDPRPHTPDSPAPFESPAPAFPLYALQECVRSASASLRAHPLRSSLTTLGITIGVAAVICVLALLQGLSHSISQQFRGLGGNTLTLRSYTPLESQLRGKFNRLQPQDLDQLRERVTGIRNLTPVVFAGQRFTDVRYGANVASGSVVGTTADYQDVQQIYPARGRFLTKSDDATSRRVAVLGEQMRRDLKLPEDPTGHFIQIAGEWFKVVGLMEARGEVFGASQDNYLLMPYRTALDVSGALTQPDLWISFTVTDLQALESTRERVRILIRRLHGLGADQPDDFVVETADTLAKSFKEVSTVVTLVVSAIVGISLLVGGVGIMNMMLVSVTERTREIGIAKALGATRRFILTQFLVEAVVMSAAGGVAGILLGYLLGFAIAQAIPNFPAVVIPWWAILGTLGFCTLIGLTFGMLPASRAADMTPMTALRHE